MTDQTRPEQRLGASFRDPSGYLFNRGGILYRQVNQVYQQQYDQLLSTGLYDRLVKTGLLIPHEEVSIEPDDPTLAYRIIRPERVWLISYPYEWCFSQLKDAALTTLAIQKLALEAGMILKDASAYNIQFQAGKPVLIDTLSFDSYHEGEPWVAYRQYCQHFLAPLALMAYRDVRLSQLMRVHLDGIPLDLAARLLPGRTRFNLGMGTHIHLHAAAQRRYADKNVDRSLSARKVSKLSLIGLIDSLESTTKKLSWKAEGTEWGDYYNASAGHYSQVAMEHKQQLVRQYLEVVKPSVVWDLGANTGEFSRIASEGGIRTLALDIDPAAVEQNYLRSKQHNKTYLMPLVMDFTNPSPALGWHNRERLSLLERSPADLIMALAFIHHMAISNNVPLSLLAQYLSDLGDRLIIEWVPKDDPQVHKLLASRQDIFSGYTLEGFEGAFSDYFLIQEKIPINDSPRMLYLMAKK